MLFPTTKFVVFFLIVFVVTWALSKRPRAWKYFILVASYVFYVNWGWKFALLLGGYTVANFFMARFLTLAKRHRKPLLGVMVVIDLLPLLIFKFSGFFAFNLLELLNGVGINADFHIADLVFPVGISFTTFRAISYLIDLYRREVKEANILDLGIFMSFFPYMASGPITRMGELLPQLRSPARRQKIDATRALYLIALGLTKKLIIGDFLARTLADGVFATPGQFSAIDVIIGIHAYAVQIYCDFSGYTDMAIGVALLLGFNLPMNFNRPYTAVTIREYWRRWHMTLSRWIRDYLYIPLGGSRKGSMRTYVNLMVAMVVAGLWHGAGWTFVIWGTLHGVYQVVEHSLDKRRKRMGLPPRELKGARLAFRRLITFELICLGWVFFKADSVGDAFAVIGRTFTGWGMRPGNYFMVILAIAIGIGFQYLPASLTSRVQGALSRRHLALQGVVFGVALFVIVGLLGAQGITHFIYMGF